MALTQQEQGSVLHVLSLINDTISFGLTILNLAIYPSSSTSSILSSCEALETQLNSVSVPEGPQQVEMDIKRLLEQARIIIEDSLLRLRKAQSEGVQGKLWDRRTAESLYRSLEVMANGLNRAVKVISPTPSKNDLDEPSLAPEFLELLSSPAGLTIPPIPPSPTSPTQQSSSPTQSLASTLPDISPDAAFTLQCFIHDSLSFRTMTDRQDQVEDAFAGTYSWMFDESVEEERGRELRAWLKSSEGIYWISGLPGAGKSTLMSYIYNHSSTKQLLSAWASPFPLQLAGFFCWISGSKEQRSQEGLLRSLLYQLLDRQLELVPSTFPSLWSRCATMTTKERIKLVLDWSMADLKDGLLRLLDASKQTRTTLFIDGLDELEGDHDGLISLLSHITASYPVKICCSSRPWPVFEKAFGNISSLRLQELTLEDMGRYARDKLGMEEHIASLAQSDPQGFESLISTTTSRASGVFLWLTLVVDLLTKAAAGPNINLQALSSLLDSYPASLDSLFRYTLITHASPSSQTDMSRSFQLLHAREEACAFIGDEQAVTSTLTLWDVATAYDAAIDGFEEEDVDRKPRAISQADLDTAVSSMRERISISCSGLLAIKLKKSKRSKKKSSKVETFSPIEWARAQVVYVHRTVKDFLAQPAIWSEISSLCTFDPHIAHTIAYITRLQKPFYPPIKDRLLMDKWLDIVPALTHARYALPTTGIVPVLDALDSTLDWYWDHKTDDRSLDYWARDSFFSYEARRNKPFHDSFLSLAVKFGLVPYVKAKIGTTPYKDGIPLLTYALDYLFNRQHTVYPLSSPEMVRAILGPPSYEAQDPHGDPSYEYPNESGRTKTAWGLALAAAKQASRLEWIRAFDVDEDGVDRWLDIFELMIFKGAKVEWVEPATDKDAAGDLKSILDGIVARYGCRRVESFASVSRHGRMWERPRGQLDQSAA